MNRLSTNVKLIWNCNFSHASNNVVTKYLQTWICCHAKKSQEKREKKPLEMNHFHECFKLIICENVVFIIFSYVNIDELLISPANPLRALYFACCALFGIFYWPIQLKQYNSFVNMLCFVYIPIDWNAFVFIFRNLPKIAKTLLCFCNSIERTLCNTM